MNAPLMCRTVALASTMLLLGATGCGEATFYGPGAEDHGVQATGSGVEFQSWRLGDYNGGTWTQTWSGALQIEGSGQAGVYFRAEAEAGVYLLRARGRGEATLRWQAPDQDLVYVPAPQDGGGLTWYIEGSGPLEVLLYADRPFSYVLESLALERCVDCTAAADMRARILSDIDVPFEPTAEFGLRLLDWTARTVKDGTGTSDALLSLVSLPQFYDYWRRDAGGGSCGEFSVFFVRVLELFGFDALTVDVGREEDRETHVTTVLALPGTQGEKYAFYVLDPTLHGYFAERVKRSPVDLASLLSRTTEHDFVTVPTHREAVYVGDELPAGPVIRSSAEGHRVTRRPLEDDLTAFWGERRLRDASGRDPFLFSLVERRISIGHGSPEMRAALESFLDAPIGAPR